MKFVAFPDIVGPTYTLTSKNAESQRCVNMYVEVIESGKGSNKAWLKPTPGLRKIWDLVETPVKRLYSASNGRVFAVAGISLFELNVGGTYTKWGSFNASPSHVRLVDNGLLLFITFNNTAYTFTFATNTFALQNDANYLGGSFVEFLDQYLIVNRPDSQQFQISPLAFTTAGSWSAGDVFTAESSPDRLTSMVLNGRELWLFGPKSYEVWFNSGDGIRPFQRIRDAAFNIGTIAEFSTLACCGQVFWLGSSAEGFGIVWTSSGYQPVRISNHAIEEILSSMSTLDDAEAWSYQVDGHFMYVLTFPSESRTLVYDITTKLWHEMDYRVPSYNTRLQHRGICQTFGFNKNLVGDFSNGFVYELSSTVYTDNGDPISRMRRSPNVGKGRRSISYRKFELNVETGLGLPSGQGSDPVISLRWSSDSAHTWSNYKTKSVGRLGKYKQSVVFNNLGSAVDRCWEISTLEPIPFRLLDCELGIDIGVH